MPMTALARHTSRCEDNIKTDLRKNCGTDADSSGYCPVTRTCEHGNEHQSSIKDGKLLA